MTDQIVQVDDNAVKLGLARFALSLRQRTSLLKEIGLAQLQSVYRTFAEQGSPSGSWAPLAPSTLRNQKSKATAGRKILILSGRLRNSIHSTVTPNGVVVGTNLVYARVQQEGSADRRGAAVGPQARIAGRSVGVDFHTRVVEPKHRLGRRGIVDKNGRDREVRARFFGPLESARDVGVKEHNRFQNIPPRPYLVIRPEDPARIRGQVVAFTVRAAIQAGLQAGGAR